MAKRVLLADDQPDNRIIFATMLRHFGYEVTEAANGGEAVARARESAPDLVLMDLVMPGVDGWAAIAELQRDPATAGIPVVAVSAHDRDTEVEARRAGCAGYLSKPLEPRTLLQAVQRWFAAAPGTKWVDFSQPDRRLPVPGAG